ncbi:MAG TPA: serine--tRNA ligase [Candidatus Limnocylindria bacterium]|nr:serine--tRNA ligase [Candidatus Limnocylindria bacterium]
MSVGLARLREEPELLRRAAQDKGEDAAIVDEAVAVDAERRRLLSEVEGLRGERKEVSARVGAALKADQTGGQVEQLRAESVALGSRIDEREARLRELEARLDDLLLRIPNPADPDVPVGGEEASVILRSWGEALAHEADGWARRPHWEVAEGLGIFDLAGGAKVTGSGFPVYRGAGAALQRALIDLMLDIHTREHGMTEIWPPALVNEASARGTGQIPDKEDQMYVVTRDDLYLVPTAEVPVTNLHRDEILEGARLPIRYVAYSPCFRREAGAAGRQTRGILRVHQFDKVEMVCFERPQDSPAALEWLTERAEVVLQRLGLAYRVKLMSTREMGFVQARKYDLEVWAPGVQEWLEVSSVSNFRDYQARRMNIRYRPDQGAKAEIVHTLNGSGLALARTVAALLETFQRREGGISVPAALHARLGPELLPPG